MENNGPVCLLQRSPAEWLVCFVPPIEHQWWHPFIRSRLKHCFMLRREADNAWTLFEPWWSRTLIATINDEEANRFLDWGKKGVILRVKEHIPGASSQMRGWLSCAALVAHVLGRRYFVYTPHKLLRRLLLEPGVTVYQ